MTTTSKAPLTADQLHALAQRGIQLRAARASDIDQGASDLSQESARGLIDARRLAERKRAKAESSWLPCCGGDDEEESDEYDEI